MTFKCSNISQGWKMQNWKCGNDEICAALLVVDQRQSIFSAGFEWLRYEFSSLRLMQPAGKWTEALSRRSRSTWWVPTRRNCLSLSLQSVSNNPFKINIGWTNYQANLMFENSNTIGLTMASTRDGTAVNWQYDWYLIMCFALSCDVRLHQLQTAQTQHLCYFPSVRTANKTYRYTLREINMCLNRCVYL